MRLVLMHGMSIGMGKHLTCSTGWYRILRERNIRLMAENMALFPCLQRLGRDRALVSSVIRWNSRHTPPVTWFHLPSTLNQAQRIHVHTLLHGIIPAPSEGRQPLYPKCQTKVGQTKVGGIRTQPHCLNSLRHATCDAAYCAHTVYIRISWPRPCQQRFTLIPVLRASPHAPPHFTCFRLLT